MATTVKVASRLQFDYRMEHPKDATISATVKSVREGAKDMLGNRITLVDATLAQDWFKAHGNDAMVKNKLIFVIKDDASANDITKEVAELKSGLEPLSIMDLPAGVTVRQ